MMHPLKAWKQAQKARALLIRTAKSQRKGCRDGVVPHLSVIQKSYRHHHIVYCEARGRKREEIEIPAQDNKPDEELIKQLRRRLSWDFTWYERGNTQLTQRDSECLRRVSNA